MLDASAVGAAAMWRVECTGPASNYVLWGTAMRLCNGFMPGYSKEEMLWLVPMHKMEGIEGFESKNLVPARQWATAGWDGWPDAPTPPGDRPNCKCECPREYSDIIPQRPDGTLPMFWLPYLSF